MFCNVTKRCLPGVIIYPTINLGIMREKDSFLNRPEKRFGAIFFFFPFQRFWLVEFVTLSLSEQLFYKSIRFIVKWSSRLLLVYPCESVYLVLSFPTYFLLELPHQTIQVKPHAELCRIIWSIGLMGLFRWLVSINENSWLKFNQIALWLSLDHWILDLLISPRCWCSAIESWTLRV